MAVKQGGRGPMGEGPHKKRILGIPPGKYKHGRNPKRGPRGWTRGKAWWKGTPPGPGEEPAPPEIHVGQIDAPLSLPTRCPAWASNPQADPPDLVNEPWEFMPVVNLVRDRQWCRTDYFTRRVYYHPLQHGLLQSDGTIAQPGSVAVWEPLGIQVEVSEDGLMPYGVFAGTYSHPADAWASYLQMVREEPVESHQWAFLWPTMIPQYPEQWESHWGGVTTLAPNPQAPELYPYDTDPNGHPYKPSSPCHQYWARLKAQEEFPDYVYYPGEPLAGDAGAGFLDHPGNQRAAFQRTGFQANPGRLRNREYEIPDPPSWSGFVTPAGDRPTDTPTNNLGGFFDDVGRFFQDVAETVVPDVIREPISDVLAAGKEVASEVIEWQKQLTKEAIAFAADTAPIWAMAASAFTGVPPQAFVLGANMLDRAVNGEPEAIAAFQQAGMSVDPNYLALVQRDMKRAKTRMVLLALGGAGVVGLLAYSAGKRRRR